METMVLDCSTAPNDPRCKGQTGVVMSSTFVLPKPARTGFQFLLGGAYSHGFADGGNIFSGGVDVGASVYHGLNGPIPGPQGGWFNALVIEPQVGVYGGAAVVSKGPGSLAAGAVFVRPQLQLGVELDTFGGLSMEDRMQTGIGFHLAYSLGAQYQYFSGDLDGSSTDFGHGPVFQLMFLEYKPIERKLIRGFLRVQLWLVSGTNTTFLNVGGGAAFP